MKKMTKEQYERTKDYATVLGWVLGAILGLMLTAYGLWLVGIVGMLIATFLFRWIIGLTLKKYVADTDKANKAEK